MASDAWNWRNWPKSGRLSVSAGHRSCLPCLFLLLLLGAVTASEELTASKPHKITKDHWKDKGFVNFIYLAYSRSKFGIKRCKIQYFMKHFSRSVDSSRGQSSQVTCSERMRSNSLPWRLHHAVSNTEDCLPVSKDAKFSILWSISHDQLTQAEVNRNNVWDQIACTVTLTSRGLKHRGLSASD